MRLHAVAPVLLLAAACALIGCAGDPHPASGSTPGDPWHPGSASIDNDQPAPITPPGSSGTPAYQPTPGEPYNTNGPATTLNGYGDPTTSEPSK